MAGAAAGSPARTPEEPVSPRVQVQVQHDMSLNVRSCHCHPNCRSGRPCSPDHEFCPYRSRVGAAVGVVTPSDSCGQPESGAAPEPAQPSVVDHATSTSSNPLQREEMPSQHLQQPVAERRDAERPRSRGRVLGALMRCCFAGRMPAGPVPVEDQRASSQPARVEEQRACPCFSRIDDLHDAWVAQQQAISKLSEACTAHQRLLDAGRPGAAKPPPIRRRGNIWKVYSEPDGVKMSQFLFSLMVVLSGLAVGFTSLVFASQVIFS